jgi:hypothetical protein
VYNISVLKIELRNEESKHYALALFVFKGENPPHIPHAPLIRAEREE